MKIKLPFNFLVLLCILCTKSFAQDGAQLRGKAIDSKSSTPIGYATAILMSTADTTKRTGAISSVDGGFSFASVTKGNYLLKISALGYLSQSLKVTIESSDRDLGVIKMEEDAISLKEVNIQGQQAAVKVKRDTLEFNAGAFQTKPNAAVEELLKKLPGVEIDKEGNILVQGQKVSRLTVDGKDFFGTDPKTATKNLPADAIAKVQIIDSKTQEAKATGIDDGQREKVLNLTIKEDKKNGWFGNANAAGGTTDRYNSYLSANHFNKNLQFAVLGMSNNINNASFAFEDLNSFSGGNIGNIFAPPGGGGFSINVNNGRTTIGGSGVFDNSAIGEVTTHSGGVNYSNSWGKKNAFSLSSSYFTYYSSGVGDRASNIQDLASSDVLRTAEFTNRNSTNQAHRFNFKAEYHPDSLTDIIFRPNVILNRTANINNRSFSSAYDIVGRANDGTQYLDQKNSTPSLFGEFSALRRLGNKKGSVSLRLNATQNTFNSDYINRSTVNTYASGSPIVDVDNQQTEQQNATETYTMNVNYVRPIFNKKWNGSIGYAYSQSNIDAMQKTYEFNALTGLYETIVPNLSNVTDNVNHVHIGRMGLIYTRTDWIFNFGVNVQEANQNATIFQNTNTSFNTIAKSYFHALPRANISFKNKANQTVQLNYNANVNLPSINDLQPVQNNSNPLYQRIGNPDLNARTSHRVSVNFNTFSPDNNKYWNGYFLYNVSFDDTGNDITYVDGIQMVKPVNVDGNYFINTGSYFGMPAKIKGLRMGYGINLFTSRATSFISSNKNVTNRYNAGPNASVSYDIEGKLNTSLYFNVGYTKVNNSLPSAVDNKYFSFNNSASMSYELLKNLRIDAQLDHIGSAGRTGGYNNNAFLLNMGIEQYFKERRFTLALKGFDVLKQNVNIERLVNSSRIEDIRYNNITRYFYLSLNYKIAKVGATSQRGNPRNTVN